jgi:hypothetical protein
MTYNLLNLQKIIYKKLVPAANVNKAVCVGICQLRFSDENLTRKRRLDIFRRLQTDTPCIK